MKLDAPNKEPDVPPKGLDVVLVVPNNPPLLVLVPKAVKQFIELFHHYGQLGLSLNNKSNTENVLPKAAGLLAANALVCWENRPPPPVLVLPKRLFDVPLVAPKPNPVLVEDVTG